jgi:hypothetical protein
MENECRRGDYIDEYIVTLKDRKQVTEDTMAFWFDVAGAGDTFRAGQNYAAHGQRMISSFHRSFHDALMLLARPLGRLKYYDSKKKSSPRNKSLKTESYRRKAKREITFVS